MNLYNGVQIPDVAFGTGVIKRFYRNKPLYFKDRTISVLKSVKHMKIDRILKNDITIEKVTEKAITHGYCLLDTGRLYGHSEKIIGKVTCDMCRDDVFIITKVSNVDLARYKEAKTVRENLSISLENLCTNYVDSYLLHFPCGDWINMYHDIEEEYKAGRTRSIGVCNFDIEDFLRLKKEIQIKPMICQVELHPLYTKTELCEYCKKEGIVIMAHTPTGHMHNKICNSDIMKRLTKKYNKSIAQIIYKWHVQNGIIPIISTVSVVHLIENLDIYNFELTGSEIQEINALNENYSFDKNNNKMNDCPNFIYNV